MISPAVTDLPNCCDTGASGKSAACTSQTGARQPAVLRTAGIARVAQSVQRHTGAAFTATGAAIAA